MHFDSTSEECRRVQAVIDAIGRRWSASVVIAAARGARRFGDLRRAIPGISDRMLALRLKELESFGLIRREVIPSTPVQVLYEPTEHGLELIQAMRPLLVWGQHYLAGADVTRVREPAGSAT